MASSNEAPAAAASPAPATNAVVPITTTKKLRHLYITLTHSKYDPYFLLLLLVLESILCHLIIKFVPYTEIDWVAYMEEVTTYQNGERDYVEIRGGTGPLVYPAGFLYLFQYLKHVGGGDGSDIRRVQYAFGLMYVLNCGVVLFLYTMVGRSMARDVAEKRQQEQLLQQENDGVTATTVPDDEDDDVPLQEAHVIWSWRIAMTLTCLSKRIHSIFVLRLFNDAPAMLLFYISTVFFTKHYWKIGCIFFSLGVSIKMNVLLYAPGLLLLLLQSSRNLVETVLCLSICAVVQIILGMPFLMTYPISYVRKAFELDRVFFYKWTVNWKFLPEHVFVSKPLALILLLMHITYLAVFAIKFLNATLERTGKRIHILNNNPSTSSSSQQTGQQQQQQYLSPQYVTYTLFLSNYIGICFARTLHYQFYSWYFHTIPFMLWSTSYYPLWIRVVLIGMIEYAFNVFPATTTSSIVLQLAHLVVLVSLVLSDVPNMVVTTDKGKEKEKQS